MFSEKNGNLPIDSQILCSFLCTVLWPSGLCTTGIIISMSSLCTVEFSYILKALMYPDFCYYMLPPSHIFFGDDPPTCQLCGLPVSVRHILVECIGLRDICTKYFTVCSVAELFQSVDNSIIINFIKEAHFYHQL